MSGLSERTFLNAPLLATAGLAPRGSRRCKAAHPRHHVHRMPLPNAPQLASFMYGPLVATRIDGPALPPGAALVAGNVSYGKQFTEPPELLALRLDGAGLDGAVRRGPGALVFPLRGSGPGEAYELLPFHKIAHGDYNLYLAGRLTRTARPVV
jgi:hypothetical protein